MSWLLAQAPSVEEVAGQVSLDSLVLLEAFHQKRHSAVTLELDCNGIGLTHGFRTLRSAVQVEVEPIHVAGN